MLIWYPKTEFQQNPTNFDPLATFDVDCQRGIILSNVQIHICSSNQCATGAKAVYELNTFFIYSSPFSSGCHQTITIDFNRDLSFLGCY